MRLMQYLKSKNAASTTVVASAGTVYNGALFQIAQSFTEGMLVDNAAITARAAETALKRLRAMLDAINAQFLLEGGAEKSQRFLKETVIEQKPRTKSHRPSTVNDDSSTFNLFFEHIYIDYNE